MLAEGWSLLSYLWETMRPGPQGSVVFAVLDPWHGSQVLPQQTPDQQPTLLRLPDKTCLSMSLSCMILSFCLSWNIGTALPQPADTPYIRQTGTIKRYSLLDNGHNHDLFEPKLMPLNSELMVIEWNAQDRLSLYLLWMGSHTTKLSAL